MTSSLTTPQDHASGQPTSMAFSGGSVNDLPPVDPADIVSRLADVTRQLKALKDQDTALRHQLSLLYELGHVKAKFSAFGFDYNLGAARVTWEYDPDVKTSVVQIQEDAKRNNKALRKEGSRSWTLKVSKPAKE